MSKNIDKHRFKNDDLILKLSKSIDPLKWDEGRYEAFIDELCGDREYQKEAIRVTLRYLLGEEFANLRELAEANYNADNIYQKRYGSWTGMERHLQLPEQLSCSLDLATGTGKSYVLYGIATILLAEGRVDRVLVLCPSITIENGLIEKFKQLSGNTDLGDLLPKDSRFIYPRIIAARESITEGSICIENYHVILEHVKSSIGDSLIGKGSRVAVLNDEVHHVANEVAQSTSKIKRWKEFLMNSEYGFKFIVGVSGTCYLNDDYFADVIYRYSLQQAIFQNYVKTIDYIAEMPKTNDPDEKWQLIYNRHEEVKRKLKAKKILPLSIIVTSTIAKCKEVAEELKAFLGNERSIGTELVNESVLTIYNNAPDLVRLVSVDSPTSKVEWIVSVSMLNEGWDVKRVFLIVPHEERAFNSKLLIAQVLGRGLRIPTGWQGAQPEVIVFNHDAWALRIKDLVQEMLEVEKRLSSRIVEASTYHFDLHTIEYTLDTTSIKKPMKGEYTLFEKGYVDLATDAPSEDFTIEFERASTGDRYKWQTKIVHKTFSVREVAMEMYGRLEEAQDPDDPEEKMRNVYTQKFPLKRLEKIVSASLKRIGASEITESMKQKFLQSLGPLRRKESENVRYKMEIEAYVTFSTVDRQSEGVSASELRGAKTYYYMDQTRNLLAEDQKEFFDEVTDQGSGYKVSLISNRFDFKTPLNSVIADHDNERKFINHLFKSENVKCYEAWIKSTATRFYEIDYAWKKGEHPKRGKFNPDIFIKTADLILVVEIKDDDEIREPSEENRKKNEFAIEHFKRVNRKLEEDGEKFRYKFLFVTERSFNLFFQYLRAGRIKDFRSELDVRLAE